MRLSFVALILPLLLLSPRARADGAVTPEGSHEKIKIGVLDLGANGIPQDLASTLTSIVATELGRLDVFAVISHQEIRALLSNDAMRQMAGCDAGAACTTDLGSALGVRYLVSGSVGKVGTEYSLNLSLTETTKAVVMGRQNANVKESSELLDAASRSAKMLVSKILSERQGTLIVTCAERGASVKIDGSIVGVTPLPRQSIGWGPHLLQLEKKGFVSSMEDFSMQTNGVVERAVTLIPSPDFLNEYQAGATRMRVGAWITSALALASIGGAAYFQIQQTRQSSSFDTAKRAYEAESAPSQADYDNLSKIRTQAETSLTATYIFTGVGVACAAGAAIFWVAGSDPDRYARYRGLASVATPGAGDDSTLAFHFLDGGLVGARFTFR